MKKNTSIRTSREDKIYYAISGFLLTVFFLIVLYPLIYVVSASFSDGKAVMAGKVVLFPVDFTFKTYELTFQYKEVFSSFFNSVVYSLVGTAINIVLTMIAAYALARKTLPFRQGIMFLFTFTMFFSGGLIPSYILVKNLGMLDSMWALILPGAISTYNMIIARTFIMNSIPEDLLEAAQIDGCSDFRYFYSIVLPLSKAVIAVLCVYYIVGHWNGWFGAFIYLFDRKKYPLQLVLREILIVNTIDPSRSFDPELYEQMQALSQVLKYALIVISSLPMMILYPFAQKFFIQGVMIGAVKG